MFLIPGGPDVSHVAADEEVLAWIRKAHETTKWSTSVCTGALILGAAGVLEGLEATTHWMMHDQLRDLGAIPTLKRVIQQEVKEKNCPACEHPLEVPNQKDDKGDDQPVFLDILKGFGETKIFTQRKNICTENGEQILYHRAFMNQIQGNEEQISSN